MSLGPQIIENQGLTRFDRIRFQIGKAVKFCFENPAFYVFWGSAILTMIGIFFGRDLPWPWYAMMALFFGLDSLKYLKKSCQDKQ